MIRQNGDIKQLTLNMCM